MLPYYGDVDLMKLAVMSVISQTDPMWHLTVVDDGKAEGVPEWFVELNHQQIRYMRNDQNLGLVANYQKCLGLVERDYMVMLGCDDVMLPNYVATVRELLNQHQNVNIVQPGVQVIDTDGKPVRTLADEAKQRIYAPKFDGPVMLGGEAAAISLLRGDWLYFPSLCWRTEDVRTFGFDQKLDVIQDLALVLQIIEHGGSLVASPELCFKYRRHSVSASSTSAVTGSRFTEARGFFLNAADRMDAKGWHGAAKAARWHLSSRIHALTMIPTALRQKNTDGAKALTQHVLGSFHN
jgi:GT2 family glycosyltransferase